MMKIVCVILPLGQWDANTLTDEQRTNAKDAKTREGLLRERVSRYIENGWYCRTSNINYAEEKFLRQRMLKLMLMWILSGQFRGKMW